MGGRAPQCDNQRKGMLPPRDEIISDLTMPDLLRHEIILRLRPEPRQGLDIALLLEELSCRMDAKGYLGSYLHHPGSRRCLFVCDPVSVHSCGSAMGSYPQWTLYQIKRHHSLWCHLFHGGGRVYTDSPDSLSGKFKRGQRQEGIFDTDIQCWIHVRHSLRNK